MNLPLEQLSLNPEDPVQLIVQETDQDSSDNNEPLPGITSQRDVVHFGLFGRRGSLHPLRSTRISWETKEPFKKPCTIAWSLPLSPAQLSRLLHGYIPMEMEDKWFIYADGPYADGSANVKFHRGWTGAKVAELQVQIVWGDDDASDMWEGQVTHLTFESQMTGPLLTEDSRSEDAVQDTEKEKNTKPEQSDNGYDAEPEDPAEDMAKFQVLEACSWVLGIRLMEEIKEPASWTRLAKMPVKMERVSMTTYRGTGISEETRQDMVRLAGSGVQMVIS